MMTPDYGGLPLMMMEMATEQDLINFQTITLNGLILTEIPTEISKQATIRMDVQPFLEIHLSMYWDVQTMMEMDTQTMGISSLDLPHNGMTVSGMDMATTSMATKAMRVQPC